MTGLLAEVKADSDLYLGTRDSALGDVAPESLVMHAVMPGIVTNVSPHGIFVRLSEGPRAVSHTAGAAGAALDGLVSLGEWTGAAPGVETPSSLPLPRIAQRVAVRVVGLQPGLDGGRQPPAKAETHEGRKAPEGRSATLAPSPCELPGLQTAL